jgi:hypothetical protein
MGWLGELYTACMYKTRTRCTEPAVARPPGEPGWWLCERHYVKVTGRYPP